MKRKAILVSSSTPKPEGAIRIACFSDTHGNHNDIDLTKFSACDILIFAGDMSMFGNPDDTSSFREWFHHLNCSQKLVISGNLDLAFDVKNLEKLRDRIETSPNSTEILENVKPAFLNDTDFKYLEHQFIEVNGLKIFASPYTPEFMDFGFQYKSDGAKEIWKAVPDDIDILITHGPPKDVCDCSTSGFHCGCEELRKTILRTKPALAVFGHIHEAHGSATLGETLCCNVAMVNEKRKIAHDFTYVDLVPAQ